MTDGKTRTDSKHDVVTARELGFPLGKRATLLQFSSAFCAPCRTTKVILGKTADAIEGVTHIEIDAESHLELVRRLDIRKTPTTLVLNSAGIVTNRAVGVPRTEELLAVLAASMDA
jgi:thiol-disulfide isomerase/thioredoxin